MPVVRKACERCRGRKLKCIWPDNSTTCSQCLSKRLPCAVPPQVPARRKTSRSTELDKRVQDLESLVSALRTYLPTIEPPLSVPGFPNGTEGFQNGGAAFSNSTLEAPGSSSDDLMSTNDSAEPPEPFPLLLEDVQAVASLDNPADLVPDPPQNMDAGGSMGKCYLPPPRQGSLLLNEYLHDFNSKLPLFHPETIYNHIRNCYSGGAEGTPLAWVMTYVIFGIAHRMRAMSLFAGPDDTSSAERYLDKCLLVLPDLLLQPPTLQLVQALLGVSILLQTSKRTASAGLFVSTAMRMVQGFGFNDVTQLPDQDTVAGKEALNTFWMTFLMDTDFSLAAMLTNAQRRADVTVPLPDGSATDWWTSPTPVYQDHDWQVNLFSMHAQLALIQADALEELFSVKARQASPTLLAGKYNDIVSALESWKRRCACNSSTPREMYNTMYRSDMIHSVILQGSYFRTLYQLRAGSALGGFKSRVDFFEPGALRAMARLGPSKDHAEASRMLALVSLTPQGNLSTTWAGMRAILVALCSVLARYLPHGSAHSFVGNEDDKAEDFRLCKEALGALELAAEQTQSASLAPAIAVCQELYAQAR